MSDYERGQREMRDRIAFYLRGTKQGQPADRAEAIEGLARAVDGVSIQAELPPWVSLLRES